METQVIDLWPEDIATNVSELTPVAILKQQASLLGDKTKNLVEAQVETRAVDFQRFLEHSFYIVAPALDHYRYLLFRVTHPGTLYPVEIVSQDHKESAGSETEFIEKIRGILSSEKTRKLVQSLIAQSQS